MTKVHISSPWLKAAMVGSLYLTSVANAHALSAGCQAFSTSSVLFSNQLGVVVRAVINLAPGEIVTFSVTGSNNLVAFDVTTSSRPAGPAGNANVPYAAGSGTQNYSQTVVSGDTAVAISVDGSNLQGTASATVVCRGPAVAPSGPTNSQILEQTRQTFSKLAASASSQAMGDATSGAIDDAFSTTGGATAFGPGGFSTNFAALEKASNADAEKKHDPFESFDTLGYAKAPYQKAPLVLQSPWHVWIDARYTGFEDRSITSFDGWQDNVTAGASYRFTQNFLAGALIGYENFKYSMVTAATPTSLSGNGVSGGGYFGWKLYDRLRLDGMLTYGRIDYGATAGPTSGSFGADRVTGMTKLSGRYGFGTFYLEPSAMLIIASEHQDSFTDSAAALHNNYNFVVGRASTGGTIGTPIAWGNCIVTPTFGAFADYRFGDENVAAVSVVPTFNNGFSGRVNGGFNVAMPGNVTASATGEYGGLGDEIRYWRTKGSIGVKF